MKSRVVAPLCLPEIVDKPQNIFFLQMEYLYYKKSDEMKVSAAEIGRIYAVDTKEGWQRVQVRQISESQVFIACFGLFLCGRLRRDIYFLPRDSIPGHKCHQLVT